MIDILGQTERSGGMRTCPCGFESAAGIPPTSRAWHVQHRVHHLDRYPNTDEETSANLAGMIFRAERFEIKEFLNGAVPIVGAEMSGRMAAVICAADAISGHSMMAAFLTLNAALGAYAAETSEADLLLEMAIEALVAQRKALRAESVGERDQAVYS